MKYHTDKVLAAMISVLAINKKAKILPILKHDHVVVIVLSVITDKIKLILSFNYIADLLRCFLVTIKTNLPQNSLISQLSVLTEFLKRC